MKLSKKIPLISILLLLWSFPFLHAQENLTAIKDMIQKADSVWILSHEMTGMVVINDAKGHRINRNFYENGRLNKRLVKETILLGDKDKYELAEIISRPMEDKKIEMAKCYMPQHAIFWKKDGKVFWIDICFACRKVEGSNGVEISFSDFDNRKWKELSSFLSQKGLKYAL